MLQMHTKICLRHSEVFSVATRPGGLDACARWILSGHGATKAVGEMPCRRPANRTNTQVLAIHCASELQMPPTPANVM